MSGNFLYYGDNLDILQRYVKDETVDRKAFIRPAPQVACTLFARRQGLKRQLAKSASRPKY